MTERKQISGFEKYYEADSDGNIHSLGRVDSLGRIWPSRILKQSDSHGYRSVALFIDGVAHTKMVHRIIAETFLPSEEGKLWVNHKNGNKADNRVQNLEWVDPSGNSYHAYDTGLRKQKSGANHSKSIGVIQKSLDGEVIRVWGSLKEIQRETGFCCGNIGTCARGITKTSYGFKWSFNQQ